MIYFVAILFPPLALLLIGKPLSALGNLLVYLIGIPLSFVGVGALLILGCVIHAIATISNERSDKRFAALISALSPAPKGRKADSRLRPVLLTLFGLLLVIALISSMWLPGRAVVDTNTPSLTPPHTPEQPARLIAQAEPTPRKPTQPVQQPVLVVPEIPVGTYLPGLSFEQVFAHYDQQGFRRDGPKHIQADGLDLGWLVTCTKEDGPVTIHVTLSGPSSDKLATASISVLSVGMEGVDVEDVLASFARHISYQGANAVKNAQWIRQHLDGGREIIGPAAFEVYGPTQHVRMFEISASGRPEVLAWNKSNPPKVVPLARKKPDETAAEPSTRQRPVTPPAVPERDPSEQATTLLALAQKLITKNPEAAARRLSEIVTKYPGTSAASEAETLLERLEK